MRTRIRFLLLTLLLFAGFTGTACGSGGGGGDTDTTGSTAVVAPDEVDEGEPIEIIPRLVEQGFREDQISAIAPDSAFWLMPFDTPFRMSQHPDQSTCIFSMTNASYEGKGAYVEHRIMSNSTVALRVRFVNPDGSMADFRDKVVTMPLSKVTPKELATNADFPLDGCGNTQLS